MELGDIQHFLLARTPALAARYEFLTFRKLGSGRAWLAGLIDKPAEIARNEKELAKLAQAIAAKQAKLAGGTFVERAPAEVVAKERASLVELEEKLAAINRALVELRK